MKINKKYPLIIAEIGVNHNGSLKKAIKLIKAAKDSGASAVKFQTFNANKLVKNNAPLATHHKKNVKYKTTHFDLLKKLELKQNDFLVLKKKAKELGLKFISTPYDIVSLEFLIKLKCDYIKIASSELVNTPLLDMARRSSIPIILSTGMSNLAETKEAINFILKKNKNLIILKCTSNYPASLNSINLKSLNNLSKIYKNISFGFSDHTIGSIAAITSLQYNVKIIEKHFTLNQNDLGPDHRASMEPKDFKKYVIDIKNSVIANGSGHWTINKEEKIQMKAMRKGTYLNKDLKKGSKITHNDVVFLRPMNDITPNIFYSDIKGKKLNHNLLSGVSLKKKYFE